MSVFALFLFDRSTQVAAPWRDAGFDTLSVDNQHSLRAPSPGCLNLDLTTAGPLLVALENMGRRLDDIVFMGCFPPCTDVAVSGSRDFDKKGLRALAKSVEFFATCREVAALLQCPWFIENPVSTMASYWRKPDYYFDPCEYTGFCLEDNYTKKTSIWAGNGFEMPLPNIAENMPPPDDRIHKIGSSKARGDLRSIFPTGFSKAAFEANNPFAAFEI